MPLRKIDERVGKEVIKKYLKKKDKKKENDIDNLPKGLQKDTTTSAYGDAGRGRPVPKFKEGGYCRGAGAAIKGTKFEGVF
mgnify:CR=1 FL=1